MHNQFKANVGQSGYQSQGYQAKFQPTGNVQSAYGNLPSQQSYHTANYRGNQPGHDNSLRSDSQSPAQSYSAQGISSSVGSQNYGAQGISSSFGGQSYGMGTGYGQSQSYQSFQSPQSYHAANYRGNQPGHDNSLRSDSQSPAQSYSAQGISSSVGGQSYGAQGISSVGSQSYSTQGISSSVGSQSYGTQGISSSVGSQNYGAQGISSFGGQSYGMGTGYGQSQSYQSFQSPQSYHAANYRGNQPGHDNSLRSDSQSPTQSSQLSAGSYGQNLSSSYTSQF
ncbi:hypothetical protein BXP28_02440 [Paenibacillus larvae subsp. larvae]|nr:hypothetical protein BXP28_02440 [Paenibacillus larvae subsp. larvae]